MSKEIEKKVDALLQSPHDPRRWRVEDGDVALRNVPFGHFSEQNGYALEERCRIGNLGIGNMTRIGTRAVFRVA